MNILNIKSNMIAANKYIIPIFTVTIAIIQYVHAYRETSRIIETPNYNTSLWIHTGLHLIRKMGIFNKNSETSEDIIFAAH